ncbi:MAG: HAMP domain-containing histidine kinase [Clostridia bacterium]|nr:HAMP domain-containing histidine kinase [Clostridia bacterium]
MSAYSYTVIALLCVIIAALIIKIYLLKKSAREIKRQIKKINAEETNSLIVISSADRDMRSLAFSLNNELKAVNTLRHKYSLGDEEIKKAVTNISHDLRTPLTSVSGYLDLLKNEEKSERAEQYLKIIENRTNAMKTLTGELFGFSVVTCAETQPDTERTDICALIEESLAANYTLLMDKGIEPAVTMPESIIINTDRNMLLRVFSNIISNAAKYSDGDLNITANESGTVCFSNTAAELTAVQAARLFDRFYTVTDARQSTGLGLSIAKELRKKLGGEISAEYENGILNIKIML